MADGQGDGGGQCTEPTACGSVACGSVWEVGNVETMENRWESSNRFAALTTLDEEEEQIVPELPPPTRSEKERIVSEPLARGTSSEKKMKKKKFCEEFKHQDSCSDECCDGHGGARPGLGVEPLAPKRMLKPDDSWIESEIDVNAVTRAENVPEGVPISRVSEGVSNSHGKQEIREASTITKERTEWTGPTSIRFNVANVQRPLAAASKVVEKGNRVVMEPGGGYIQNISTGEKIKLRIDRGVYVFDVRLSDGAPGVVALDSGAGVNVWPKTWSNDAKMEEKIKGLTMVAANGTEIENLGQKAIKFKAVKPVDFTGQLKR